MALALANTVKLQQIASNPRNSAWVFASAGAGKTKVLTDRVLRLLLDGVLPSKILCLTFTKTAATEMQERINARLAELVLLDDQKLSENIALLTGGVATEKLLKKARILFAQIVDAGSQIKVQTIHAFCQNLIKIFPFEVGVKPNFEVMDDNLEAIFLQKAKKEILLQSLENQGLQEIVKQISGKLSEDNFLELIAKILAQKERLVFLKNEFGNTQNIIAEIFKIFAVESDENEAEIFAKYRSEISCEKILQMSYDLAGSDSKTNQKNAKLLKICGDDFSLKNFPTYKEIFFTKGNEPRKVGSIFTKGFEHYTDFVLQQQGLIEDFLDHINSCKTANGTALLLNFIDQILEKYQELKNKNSLLDYNDLIIKTEQMLHNQDFSAWIKMRMDGFFDHILIDESQDTNHRQWNIVKVLTEDFFSGEAAQKQNRTIFIIGDDKQSIYSFQGSEPNISHEIFSYYQQKLAGSSFKLHKIDLSNSFRSLPNILQMVDMVFEDNKHLGTLDYQAHNAIREGAGKVEIWPQIKLQKTPKEKTFAWQEITQNNDDEICEQEILAEIIALKIKGWIVENRALQGKNRPINYGDIMILLRNRKNGFDKLLQQKFYENDIPFNSTKKTDFAEELIIQDLLAAAKFALLTHDDLNLAALLKSPFFAFDEEKLLRVATIKNQNEISLFEALKLDKSSSQDVLFLEEIIKKSRTENCFAFFSFLLSKDFYQKFNTEFGHQGAPTLDQFLIRVFSFYKNTSPNLQKFIDFAQKLNPRISLEATKSNRVIITTIHAAKGLQAPIVIIPDCCFNFKQSPTAKENLLWAPQEIDGKKLLLPVWCLRKDEEGKLVKMLKSHKTAAAHEEYWRLFYVAMTRAEDELYIAGFGVNAVDSWHEIARQAITNKASHQNFLDSLTPEQQKNIEKKVAKFNISDKMLVIN